MKRGFSSVFLVACFVSLIVAPQAFGQRASWRQSEVDAYVNKVLKTFEVQNARASYRRNKPGYIRREYIRIPGNRRKEARCHPDV